MSINADKTKTTIQSIFNFIQAEPSYLNITNQYKVNLAKIMAASQSTFANCITMGQDLTAVFSSWNSLKPTDSDEVGVVTMSQLVIQIDSALEELKSLKNNSTAVNIEAIEVMTQLSSVSATLHANYQDEQTKIAQCTKNINATVAEINKINNELSGSSGFWEGFKTGLSFGIYSGLRDKLSAQKKLRETYTFQLVQLNSSSVSLNADNSAINQINSALSVVNSLDACIVDLENTMITLSTLAATTEHDGDQEVSTHNGKVAEFYKNRFKKDMTDLLQWQNVFPD